MSGSVRRQAERLYGAFSELARRYSFRDRDQICCYGLSVSQCYTLEALASGEPKSMGELAAHLCLKISSVTRVVDHLVEQGFARREADASDRRVCRVRISSKGRALVAKINGELVAEYEQVLRNVPAESREAVIQAVSELLGAFEKRGCCDSAEVGCGC